MFTRFVLGLDTFFSRFKSADKLQQDLLYALCQVHADRVGMIVDERIKDPSEYTQTVVINQLEKVGKLLKQPPHKMQAKLGYSVQIDHSRIRGAGFGLFLKGTVPPGTIIAFYPGTIYPFSKCEIQDQTYCCSVPDGILDGNPRDPFVKKMFMSNTNNMALANYMNHPPKGGFPNVIDLKMAGVESHFPSGTVPTRVIQGAEEEVGHYIPAAITTRYLSNEEIYWNYAFDRFEDRQDEVPVWFHAVSYKAHYLASLRDARRLLGDPESYDSHIEGDEVDPDVIFKD